MKQPHYSHIWHKKENSQKNFIEFCQFKLGCAPHKIIQDLEGWLNEDYGEGCVTLQNADSTQTIVDVYIIAKQDFVIAGIQLAAQTFRICSHSDVVIMTDKDDGEYIKKGEVLLALKTTAGSALLAERVALNIFAKLSGIATKTREIKNKLLENGVTAALLETRKTTPGLRRYEKYATRVGGARNHRLGLDNGAMLKENHLRTLGEWESLIPKMQENLPILTKCEIEVSNLEEFQKIVGFHPDVIMLDNFNSEDILKAVELRNRHYPSIKIEISGNMDERNFSELSNYKVDYLSMGALIHKAVWVDMSMQIYPVK